MADRPKGGIALILEGRGDSPAVPPDMLSEQELREKAAMDMVFEGLTERNKEMFMAGLRSVMRMMSEDDR